MRKLFWVLLSVALGSVVAQDFRATITGQVSDPSKAAIPDAIVKATQRSTGAVTQAKTNQDGYFTLTYLQPSTYDIEVSADGFSKSLRQNVTLLVAEKLDLPFTLQVGEMTQAVTVSADAIEVQSADASGGLNFDSMQTSEYPLNGRQVYMLMDLSPGVLFTQEQFGVSGFSGTRGWDVNGEYVMNGGVKGSNSFTLNGAPISVSGSWQLAPNVDAIQEFKVMTNTYDASIGRTGGGSVNTTLKSGSNAWHGTLFEYHRNAIFDANYTQNNRVGAPRGKHITHQYGGTLGGKVRRDKEFVFFSFEGFRERVPFPVVSSTVPLDMRDGQHFDPYKIKIYDPLTARACVPGVDTTSVTTGCYSPYQREPFPGNVIPQNRISPVGQKILSLYPAPNMPGQQQNFVASNNTGRYFYDQPMGRWDRIIDDKTRLNGIVTFQHGEEYRNQNGFPGLAAYGNIHSQRTNFNSIASFTRILSPSAILDARLSFGRFTSFFPEGELSYQENVKTLGMDKMPHAPTSTFDVPPRIGVDQFTDVIGNSYSWSTDNQWNFVPTITLTRGTKTIRFGADFVYIGRGSTNSGRANGQFNFTRKYTQRYPLRGIDKYDGAGIADLLIGNPGSGYIEYNDTYYRTWPYFGFFVQNDWKIRRKITLNLGLRYDVQIPFVERWNRINSGFDFNAKNPLSDAVLARWATLKSQYDATSGQRFSYPDAPSVLLGGKTFVDPNGPRRTYNTDWTNIQPRFGIAYLMTRQTVLRGGFGIYHRTVAQGNYTDGFNQRTDYIDSLDGGINPTSGLTGPYSLVDPYPNGIIAPSGRDLGLQTNVGRGVSLDGRQRPLPTTFQYSFGIQRRVSNILFDVSYVGSYTNHDSMSQELDYYPWNIFMAGQKYNNFLDRTVPNPFYGILPSNSTFGASPNIAAKELYRPYPLFSGISISTQPWSKYRYDSIQLRVEKRFFGNRAKTGGLTAVFSYTFSKNFEANHRLNSWNLNEQPIHELVSYDKPQNISFHGVWDIPFGRGRYFYRRPNRFTDPMVSGWNINWIYRYISGNPVSKPDALFFCNSYIEPNQDKFNWFNNDPTCYRGRAGYTLRTVEDRFANIRQPDMPSLNVTASKTFRLTERWSLNFRLEAFNVLNKPLFGGPNTDFRNAQFGQLPISQQNFPRVMQVSGRFIF
jgi:hypothetical protein